MEKKIVLVLEYYKDDGWYGKRYRIVLQPEKDKFFTTKTEAKKYTSLVKKFIKREKPYIGEFNGAYQAELDSLIDYQYRGAFPSLHYDRTTLELDKINK